ncbi:helix-turn-helix domain-containing protein [Streptomyces sparsogenes]|uniref:Putative Ni, Fe-hydrogenase n=1 Tax=Streptomyces sparsogenes DSM 40356 TaxID=1331668 RepID=A0A1R1S837_9ACTN|nr:helix-turn-helix domain-containing protein [Streptomyces sparsogenes]OMI34454.1 putative Ni, Fe-hydrogenase [Streptomyces sparsogenes DSM 40356]
MTTATHPRTCHCENCDRRRRRAKKQRALNRHLGIPNRLDPTLARHHLAKLRQTMSWVHIAEASGCSAAHLRNIAAGRMSQINRQTHEKIMAVQPAERRDSGFYIDATGSVRRVRALMAIGHSQYAIAEAAKTATCRVWRLAQGQATMRQKLADKIEHAYKQLAHTPGTSTRARSIAAAGDWRDPLWWEDMGGIDDPQAPEHDIPTPRHIVIGENALELEAQGYSRQHAAQRLGVSLSTLETNIRRYRQSLQQAA